MVIARIFSHWAISVKFPYILLTLIPCRGEVRPKKQNKIIPQETKNSHAAIFYREILRKLQRLHLNATVETLGLWGGAPDWLLGGGLLSAHRHYFVKGPRQVATHDILVANNQNVRLCHCRGGVGLCPYLDT